MAEYLRGQWRKHDQNHTNEKIISFENPCGRSCENSTTETSPLRVDLNLAPFVPSLKSQLVLVDRRINWSLSRILLDLSIDGNDWHRFRRSRNIVFLPKAVYFFRWRFPFTCTPRHVMGIQSCSQLGNSKCFGWKNKVRERFWDSWCHLLIANKCWRNESSFRAGGHPAIRVNREVLQIGAKGGIISSKSLNFGTFSLIIVEGKK